MILSELFFNIKAAFIGNKNIDIKGLEYDSRKIKQGYLFFALDGTHVKGSDFAQQAIANGAVCIVSNKEIKNLSVTNVVVEDVSDTMSKASAKFYGYPDKQMTIIGVTGTNGKTSITYMTESVFKNFGIPIGVIGTINYRYGSVVIEAPNTTPQSLDLFKMMSEMVSQNIKYLIMEVSSHSLVLGRVKDIEFDIAVWTNLTRDHLDFHKNIENYFNAKYILFSSLKNNEKNNKKYAIINSDDFYGKKIIERLTEKVNILTYSVYDKTADFNADNLKLDNSGSGFELKSIYGNKKVQTPHIGLHNVYNILAVICICKANNFNFDELICSVKKTASAPGRFEKIISKQKAVTVIVDYAHTDDALKNVISAIKNLKHKRIITVFGCGGNRDKTKRPKMAKVACLMSDFVFITSDNPREEDPVEIIKDIEKGAVETGNKNYKIVIDRRQAIKQAIDYAQKDDIVLLAGKGHETYQIIGREKIHFDDKQEAKNVLGLNN
ncbi:UDP-N-acetylmuramoyl-L-alanyl-D-glutamate--2,6-diaminopimelate ligase [Candidatus Ruminimicrobium bovinum]|uniref:UDP-N-acetylmuramoyl-L-alanyl-D-glutamate--2, 6-diaminopimelate ligase n=1 Tax=Candidatus Ruminimicrobium bovinum TaxID=3242779 RepID=UPI0039B97648